MMDMKLVKIYTQLTVKGVLLEHHRRELKFKRGFNDHTVDSLRFFSGGEYLSEVVLEMKQEFSEKDLVDSGLLEESPVSRNGDIKLVVSSKITQDNIIIPFLEAHQGVANGEIYHLYPHKNGFKGIEVKPYCRFLMQMGKGDTILITESPFKGVALFQVFQERFSYCGLSGISSFSGKNFDKLDFPEKIKKAIFIFDNEVKNNPDFPNYKPDFWKRYDAEFYAYIMAWKLGKAGIETTIATLPHEWMRNGKIDCDGALAQGRKRDAFEQVLKQALKPTDYLKSLKDECKWVVDRKIKRYFFNTSIEESGNSYYFVKNIKEDKQERIRLTNFTMEITKVIRRFDVDKKFWIVDRYIRITDNMGNKSDEIKINPTEMESPYKFKEFVRGKGCYTVYNTQRLAEIWEKLEIETRTPDITTYSGIGRVQPGLWVFGDCMISDEKVFPIGESGMFQEGYKAIIPPSNQRGLPYLMGKKTTSPEDIINMFFKSIGYQGIILISFIPATLFSDVLFDIFHQVPILGVFGKTGSGKTTIVRWMMACFGIKEEPVNIATSTEKGIVRSLVQRINLPFWLDEYRNNAKIQKMTQTLLNIYNRADSIRAEFSNDDQTQFHEIKGTLILSGQSTPDDEALYSRIVGVNLSEWDRNNDIYDKILKTYKNFSNLTLEILKKEKQIKEILPQKIIDFTEIIMQEVADSRVSENYGACIGSLDAVIEILKIEDKLNFNMEKFRDFLFGHIKTNLKRKKEKDELLAFFKDINRILCGMNEDEREEKKGGIGRYFISDKNEQSVYLAIHELWAIYEEDMRKRGNHPTFTSSDIISYIEKEPYFKGYPKNQKHIKKFSGKPKVCIILDYQTVLSNLLPSVLIENPEKNEELFSDEEGKPG